MKKTLDRQDLVVIAGAIHAYPTLAPALRRAVSSYYAPKLFSPATRRLVRRLQRFVP